MQGAYCEAVPTGTRPVQGDLPCGLMLRPWARQPELVSALENHFPPFPISFPTLSPLLSLQVEHDCPKCHSLLCLLQPLSSFPTFTTFSSDYLLVCVMLALTLCFKDSSRQCSFNRSSSNIFAFVILL